MRSVIHNTGAIEMSRVMSMKRVRRSAGQWRELLSRFASSGLGVTEFCRRESVSTASFYQWRCRLGAADRVVARKAEAPAAFVDLGAVSCGVFTPAAAMELHLDLGGGLSLHLVRR
jgi:putative transposase